MDDSRSKVELMLERACPDGRLEIVSTHSDGLVAVTTDNGQIFVCNPATKEFVTFPLGRFHNHVVRGQSAAIGYDPWRNRYVFSRYFYRCYPNTAAVEEFTDDSIKIGHEIFVLGAGDSWEVIEAPPTSAIVPTPPVCIGGCFYWCTDDEMTDVNPSVLLRFSLHNHRFDMVPSHPSSTSDDVYGYNTVSELGGKLCYTHMATETTSRLWMLDGDMARPEWSLRCCIDAVVDVRCISPLVAGGGQILLSVDDELPMGGVEFSRGWSTWKRWNTSGQMGANIS